LSGGGDEGEREGGRRGRGGREPSGGERGGRGSEVQLERKRESGRKASKTDWCSNPTAREEKEDELATKTTRERDGNLRTNSLRT